MNSLKFSCIIRIRGCCCRTQQREIHQKPGDSLGRFWVLPCPMTHTVGTYNSLERGKDLSTLKNKQAEPAKAEIESKRTLHRVVATEDDMSIKFRTSRASGD